MLCIYYYVYVYIYIYVCIYIQTYIYIQTPTVVKWSILWKTSKGVRSSLSPAKLGCRGSPPRGPQRAQEVGPTRYSFCSRPLYRNQYYDLQTPPLFGHSPPLHRPHYCAMLCFPLTILICNTCHTLLVMAVSCEGHAGGHRVQAGLELAR